MRLTSLCLGLALSGAVSVSHAVLAQEAEKHVFVTVVGSDGAPIDGLTAQHFAIREGGRDRTVLRVEPLRIPMHVAVLVDTSSVSASDDVFRTSLTNFVERLAAFNHVAVYAFGDRATPVVAFTQDVAQLRAAMARMFGWQHTRSALMDGIDLALRDLEKVEAARPVIIAVSSESPEASGRSAGSVIKRMIAQSTAFHAVSLSTATGSSSAATVSSSIPTSSQRLQQMAAAGEGDRERNQALQQGTTLTGGSRQRLTNIMAVSGALNRLAAELANGYRVTFERKGSDRVRDLQVGIMLEGVTVRATAAPFGTR